MAVPERVLSNHDLEAIVETSDNWIRERTGIRERRIAGEQESSASLGFAAARQALEVADLLPSEIDLIIVATSTPEHIFPSTASLIQDWLGASNAGAFDLSAACTGFIYALNLATQSILSGSIRTALVIGAETMSRVLDWEDRGTCILFGDGAGAVVLKAGDAPGGVLSSVLRSDGSGWDLLSLPTVGSKDVHLPDAGLTDANGTRAAMFKLHMNGREVFRFATKVIKECVQEALAKAELSLSEVDWIVPHQANQRIIDSAARSLGVPPEKFIVNLDRYGNTSAASIPLALCEAVADGRIQPDQTLVLVGFGGGLTWGASVVRWTGSKPVELPLWKRQRRRLVYFLARTRSRLTRTLRRIGAFLGRSQKFRRLNERLDRIPWEDDNGSKASRKQL